MTESQSRVAVDVALLPDGAMTACAIELNRQLRAVQPGEIDLGPDRSVPHVSLAMGTLAVERIPRLGRVLAGLVARHPLGPATAVRLTTLASAERVVTSLTLAPTADLRALQSAVLAATRDWLSDDVTPAMLRLEGEAPRPSTLAWIRSYREKVETEGFDPHITLGYGRVPAPDLPLKFGLPRLAVCHLGNGCTCRAILFEVPTIRPG